MPKGKHKGGRRCFTNFDDLKNKQEKEEKEKAWRKARGESDSDDDSDKEKESESSEESAAESGGDDEDRKPKAKGTEGVIEIENPNHLVPKTKKVSSLNTATPEGGAKPQLSRKEREEIDRQKKAANYRKLHSQGKTEEARADLERLTLIKKQREEAQKKKEDERLAKEAASVDKRDKLAKAMSKS